MGSVHLRCELIVVAALAGCGALSNADHIQAGGHDRAYLLHLPAHPPPGRYPLVLVFHGGGGTARGIERETRFDELADREGFAVAYPQGLGRHWNDGRSGNGAADIDDVGYVSALIDGLVAAYPIDPSRVFVTGISNGGFMSYRLACQLSDKIAAAAPVAAQVSTFLDGRCAPVRPVSLLAINGTADPLVPWNGGHVMGGRGEILATPRSIDTFVLANHCAPAPATRWEPDRDPDDGTTVQDVAYGGCEDGVAVELLNINGGGHTWPGGNQYLPKAIIGPVSRELWASERIWQFFAQHGRAPVAIAR